MPCFHRRRISRRLRIFLNDKCRQEAVHQSRILVLSSDQERFDHLTSHVIGLLERDSEGELRKGIFGAEDDDGDDDPPPRILLLLVQFFIDHWQEILALIMMFFKTPGNPESLELSEAPVASIPICSVPEDWEEQMKEARKTADRILGNDGED